MTDAADVQLPPPPKVDHRTKEAREARRRAAPTMDPTESVKAQMAHAEPTPNEVRTRPSRAETVKRERRRREGVDHMGNLKLSFRFKPDQNYEYRWINHGTDGQRIHDKTKEDDWEIVSTDGTEHVDGVGTAMRRAVGKDASGPIYSYLCRKPKDWYEADHRKLQSRNDEMMRHIKQGKPPSDIGRALKTSDHVYGAEDIRVEEAKAGS